MTSSDGVKLSSSKPKIIEGDGIKELAQLGIISEAGQYIDPKEDMKVFDQAQNK